MEGRNEKYKQRPLGRSHCKLELAVGRVLRVVAHCKSINIGKSSVHRKMAINDRWQLTTRAAYSRFHYIHTYTHTHIHTYIHIMCVQRRINFSGCPKYRGIWFPIIDFHRGVFTMQGSIFLWVLGIFSRKRRDPGWLHSLH